MGSFEGIDFQQFFLCKLSEKGKWCQYSSSYLLISRFWTILRGSLLSLFLLICF